MLMRDILTLYWDEHGCNTAKWKDVQRAIGHLVDHFGKLKPTDIRQKHVDGYIARRGIGLGTVRWELTVMRTAVNHAFNYRAIGDDDRVRFRLPEAPAPRDRWLRPEEVERLISAARATRTHRMSRAERFIWLGLETGARRRSIETLTWDRVNLKQGGIDYRTPGKTPTKKRQAVAPISSALRPILELAYRERCSGFVLDTSKSVYRPYLAICKKADIEDVTAHTLRHTCATRLIKRGVDVYTVSQLLGNSVESVMRVYGHTSWEDVVEAVG